MYVGGRRSKFRGRSAIHMYVNITCEGSAARMADWQTSDMKDRRRDGLAAKDGYECVCAKR